MTKEEKDLLLQDLCSRLLYGVKIELTNSCGYHHENIAKKGDITIDTLRGFSGKYFTINHDNPLDWDWADNEIEVEDIKPYLFPLSSMTEEQKKEYNFWKHEVPVCHYEYGDVVEEVELFDSPESFEYLIKNHFDYHGLIPMGLAVDATNKNIY